MTHKPGTFVNLFVVEMNSHEIILEDAQKTEFFMPSSEQSHKLSVGAEVMAILYTDGSGLWASMRLEKHANHDISDYSVNDEVDLYIIKETPLGYKRLSP